MYLQLSKLQAVIVLDLHKLDLASLIIHEKYIIMVPPLTAAGWLRINEKRPNSNADEQKYLVNNECQQTFWMLMGQRNKLDSMLW